VRAKVKIAPAAPGAQFAGEKPHQREARPLAETERSKKLLFGVLERRTDAINRGE
jgi:hypothetical protein